MKTDYWSYVKLIGGSLLTFPLGWAFFGLDYDLKTAFFIALALYVIVIILGIFGFNYLETGNFTKSAKNDN